MSLTTKTYDHYLEIGGYEYEIEVTATYTPPCPGGTDSYGLKTEPDTPEDVELTSVKIKDSTGTWVELPHLEAVNADLTDWWLEQFKGEE